MNQERYARYRVRMIAAAVLLAAAGFAVGLSGCRRAGDEGHQGHGPAAETPAAGKPAAGTQMYTCSMHPQVRSPDPNDKCPICAMSLIPVPSDDGEPDEAGAAPRLRLSERAAALMEIRTWPVARRPVEVEVRLFGQVGFDESRVYDVAARTDAYVERLAVNTPWQPVAAGELLAELYSPAVVTALRELLVVRAGAGEMLEAARGRLVRMGVTDAEIDGVLQSGEAPRVFRAVSPAAGVALVAAVRQGEWLREGDRLVRVADLSRVWVNLEAYERDLAWLAAGALAAFETASQPGRTFEGAVTFVNPVLDERTRTVRLRVEADNADGALKPGLFVSAQVRSPYRPPAGMPDPDAAGPLVIPASAPLLMGRRAMVYVRVPGEDRPVFEPRPVTLGPRAGDVYVVEAGLVEGDLVVVNGQFKIDSELQIRGRPSMMSAEAPEETEKAGEPGLAVRRQTHCPVMGGPIDPDVYVDVNGYRIYVCCPGCDTAIKADPDRYIRKLQADGVQLERVPAPTDGEGGAP